MYGVNIMICHQLKLVCTGIYIMIAPLFLVIGISEANVDAKIVSLVETAETFHAITQKSKAAVVYIHVKKIIKENNADQKASNEFFNDPLLTNFFGDHGSNKNPGINEKMTASAHGSGFIINADGYVLTNSHVVNDAQEITVRLMDKREIPATIIGQDPKSDVALLKIDGADLPVISMGDSSLLKVGEWAIAIGSPFEMMQTVTVGIISATGRSSIGISEYEDFIQTDAAINPGNSGGPLLNIHGQVIGINTAFLTQSGGYMGIGFAIPVNMAKVIAERLQKDGKMTRAWLGIRLKDISQDLLKEKNLPAEAEGKAAIVSKVEEDSPAAKLSLQKGDIILAMNDISIAGAADLRNRIALSAPGSTITLQYLRAGQKLSTSVRLGEKEDL